jgi:hypothetical protein
MPKLSKTEASIHNEFPGGDEWVEHIDDTTCNIVSLTEASDLAPLMVGLPDDRCQCPHWGYVAKGRIYWTFADRKEVIEAGEAFYVGPGHTPAADANTEFVLFSPKDEYAKLDAHLTEKMRQMQG